MNGKTILVVDDEPPIRYMLDLKLRQAGFSVISASNGRDGYKLACEHRPDLVVSDYQMPVWDGLEFCQQLAADPETGEIPVVMLTARGHKVPPAELEKTNIRCFLNKPFSPRDLIVQIKELLQLPSDESIPVDDVGLSAA
ncbi:MAG: response regulator [Phycisphaerales bacterium]